MPAVRHDRGRLVDQMESLGFKLREGVLLQRLTPDVHQTSAIESEALYAEQVRSTTVLIHHMKMKVRAHPFSPLLTDSIRHHFPLWSVAQLILCHNSTSPHSIHQSQARTSFERLVARLHLPVPESIRPAHPVLYTLQYWI